MDLQVGARSDKPSKAFEADFRTRLEFLRRVFPQEQNPQAVYPPQSAAEFLKQRFLGAPTLHQHVTRELFTLLREIDRSGRVVNDKKLYDHQLAYIIWVALSLTHGRHSPDSFFIEGAPGVGKTLTLGILMQACIRLQLRGLLKGKIAYCTAKLYHLPSKIRGVSMSKRRILRAPPYDLSPKDVRKYRRDLFKMNKGFMDAYFPNKAWEALFEDRPRNLAEANHALERSLGERDRLDALRRAADEEHGMVETIAKILVGRATIVKGPSGNAELLEMLPPEEECDVTTHTGDAAFAIPHESYSVFAKESLGVSNSEAADADLVLIPASIFTSTVQFEKFKDDVHRDIRVIFCDEAQRRGALTFQGPVSDAGGVDLPLVFAAASRWYDRDWDCRSPRHSFPESIRRRILPDIGVRLFPSASAVHYPAESREALDQLFRGFFRPLRYFEKLELPQPRESNTLFVVHSKLTGMVAERLRQSYARKGPKGAQVWCYIGGDEEKEKFQSWFVTAREGPNVLVASPAIVKESLDLPTIRHLIVATRVSGDVLYHLIGRLTHGSQLVSRRDRVLLSLQRFANSNLHATPFHILDHARDFPEENFFWVPGHILMSGDGFKWDRRRTRGKENEYGATKLPDNAGKGKRARAGLKIANGGPLIQKEVARISQFSSMEKDLHYNRNDGPPKDKVVEAWAVACGGMAVFRTYSGALLIAAKEAYERGEDPRKATERKIAQLRERDERFSSVLRRL